MKICVLVKEVPDARAFRRVDSSTGRLDRSGESGLNSYDRYALEAAIRIRESAFFGATEIVAITMAPAIAHRTLRRALALGADRAIHLCDDALAGCDAPSTGYALAQVLRSEQPQLTLCGELSADAGTEVVPAIVAEHLQAACVTAASVVAAGDAQLTVERQTEVGVQQLLVTMPAVISVTATANTPRYVSLKETIEARSRRVEVRTCADFEIDPARVGIAASAVICGDWAAPPERQAGVVLEPIDAAHGARVIVEWLAERKLI